MVPSLPANLSTQDEQELADTVTELNGLHRAMLLQSIKTQRLRNLVSHLERKFAWFHCTLFVSEQTTGLVIGEWVQITNSIRDEFRTVRRVEKISVNNTFIYIKGFSTGTTFKRSPRHLHRLPSQDAIQLIFRIHNDITEGRYYRNHHRNNY